MRKKTGKRVILLLALVLLGLSTYHLVNRFQENKASLLTTKLAALTVHQQGVFLNEEVSETKLATIKQEIAQLPAKYQQPLRPKYAFLAKRWQQTQEINHLFIHPVIVNNTYQKGIIRSPKTPTLKKFSQPKDSFERFFNRALAEAHEQTASIHEVKSILDHALVDDKLLSPLTEDEFTALEAKIDAIQNKDLQKRYRKKSQLLAKSLIKETPEKPHPTTKTQPKQTAPKKVSPTPPSSPPPAPTGAEQNEVIIDYYLNENGEVYWVEEP